MIYKVITDEYYFWNWIKHSDSYSNNFTLEGAKAVQAWFEELSDSTDENIEFDPIAWCVEFTEYKTALDAYNEQHGEDEFIKVDEGNTAENAEEQALEWLQDNTSVIEFNGGIVIQDF